MDDDTKLIIGVLVALAIAVLVSYSASHHKEVDSGDMKYYKQYQCDTYGDC